MVPIFKGRLPVARPGHVVGRHKELPERCPLLPVLCNLIPGHSGPNTSVDGLLKAPLWVNVWGKPPGVAEPLGAPLLPVPPVEIAPPQNGLGGGVVARYVAPQVPDLPENHGAPTLHPVSMQLSASLPELL